MKTNKINTTRVYEIQMANKWQFDGITIAHHLVSYSDHSLYSSTRNDELVRLHFGLKGDYRFTCHEFQKSFDLIGGHHNILYSKTLNLDVFNKSKEIETFGIDIPKAIFIDLVQDGNDVLKVFCENIIEGKSTIISSKWGSISSSIQQVIDEIVLNPYVGKLQEIFLFSKTLELLVLCIDNYVLRGNLIDCFIKNDLEKEKIIAARDYINNNLSSPPNLNEVSKYVGLNEFKLKHGFKEMFDSTIFGYLKERRLYLSRQLLRNTKKSIAEISYEMGYSSQQHFSNQFKVKFGITPNSIRKKS